MEKTVNEEFDKCFTRGIYPNCHTYALWKLGLIKKIGESKSETEMKKILNELQECDSEEAELVAVFDGGDWVHSAIPLINPKGWVVEVRMPGCYPIIRTFTNAIKKPYGEKAIYKYYKKK